MSASLLDLIFELVDGLSVLRGLRLVSFATSNLIDPKIISYVYFIVARFKVSAILDNNEGAPQYYYFDDWGPR